MSETYVLEHSSRELDRLATSDTGVDGYTLMCRAATAACRSPKPARRKCRGGAVTGCCSAASNLMT